MKSSPSLSLPALPAAGFDSLAMEAQFKRQPTPKEEIRPDPHRWEAPLPAS